MGTKKWYLTVKNLVIPKHELHQNILRSSLKQHLGVLKENALLITSQVILSLYREQRTTRWKALTDTFMYSSTSNFLMLGGSRILEGVCLWKETNRNETKITGCLKHSFQVNHFHVAHNWRETPEIMGGRSAEDGEKRRAYTAPTPSVLTVQWKSQEETAQGLLMQKDNTKGWWHTTPTTENL